MEIGIDKLQSQLLNLKIARVDPEKLLSENLLTHWWFWGLICSYLIIVIYVSKRKTQLDFKKYLNSKIIYYWSEVIKWLILSVFVFSGIGFFYPDMILGQKIMGMGLSLGIVVFMVLITGFPISILMLSMVELKNTEQKFGLNNLAARGFYTALIAFLLFTLPVLGVLNSVFCSMINAGEICSASGPIVNLGGWIIEKFFSIWPGILLLICILIVVVINKVKK